MCSFNLKEPLFDLKREREYQLDPLDPCVKYIKENITNQPLILLYVHKTKGDNTIMFS